ncbi:MAG: M23 family metallopeptidase [Bdellovibrionales bacterium]|nr:M23 family metallopeptidase [Bdellovibrionales bacterium]
MRKPVYTFFISKSNSPNIRKIHLKQKSVHSFLIAGVLLLLVFSFFLTDYLNLHADRIKILRLEKENKNWANKFARLETQLNALEGKVQEAEKFTKKLHLITNLDLKENNLNVFGIGKISSHPSIMALSKVESRSPSSLQFSNEYEKEGNLKLRVKKLKGKAELIKQDAWVLYSNLSEQKDVLNSTPSLFPVKGGWTSSHFGYRSETFFSDHEPHFHKGIDIASEEGSIVIATAYGEVSFAGYDDSGFGNLVIIDHGYGLKTYYAHLAEIQTERGKKVEKGEIIATVGNTGRSTGPHLHYEVRIFNVPVNPINYMLDYPVTQSL